MNGRFKFIGVGLVLLAVSAQAQGQNELTPLEIVDRSIGFCGGEERIAKVETAAVNYLFVDRDGSKAIISQKTKIGKKFVQSVLSRTHKSQTIFFDGKTITQVDGNSLINVDAAKTEEVKLRSYNPIQYGYKEMECTFARLPDEKFTNFDCYVVAAVTPAGYSTINYFDKTNYRLLMVMYPNGDKSLMIEYVFKDSVLFNSRIINTFRATKDSQELVLQDVTLNPELDDIWFNCPYKTGVVLPAHIKTGAFESIAGAKTKTIFARTNNSQDYFDENGKLLVRRFLKWASNDTYGMIDEAAIRNNDRSPESEFLVRIISWNNDGYVCHWWAGQYFDTDHYKVRKP